LILPLLWKVVQLILLPLVAGQILRPLVHKREGFLQIAPFFKWVNHSIILFIVYAAFCGSMLSDSWIGIGAGSIWMLFGATLSAVLVIHLGVWISSGWIGMSHQERVSALFCGSQKTLAAGAPMAVAIFASENGFAGIHIGLLMLPLLCYHPVQLFLAAIVLPKLSASH
jgi:sodium/bile acid cotransporter 7